MTSPREPGSKGAACAPVNERLPNASLVTSKRETPAFPPYVSAQAQKRTRRGFGSVVSRTATLPILADPGLSAPLSLCSDCLKAAVCVCATAALVPRSRGAAVDCGSPAVDRGTKPREVARVTRPPTGRAPLRAPAEPLAAIPELRHDARQALVPGRVGQLREPEGLVEHARREATVFQGSDGRVKPRGSVFQVLE